MLTTLYGNLPPPETSSTTASTASSSPRHAVDNVVNSAVNSETAGSPNTGVTQGSWAINRAKLFIPPNIRKRSEKNEVVDSRKHLSGQSSSMRHSRPVYSSNASKQYESVPTFLSVTKRQSIDEYDPARPNNYEQIMKDRAAKKRLDAIEKKQEEEMRKLKENREKPSNLSLNISGAEAYKRRGMLSSVDDDLPINESSAGGKKHIGVLMMEKMGWKEGEGLGRNKQGIVAPLVARKLDKKSGVIVPGKQTSVSFRSISEINAMQQPTRVVVLKNLVGRDSVDEDLEAETAEEGAKCGNLLGVKVLTIESVSDDEAVRVFLEYESVEDAMKAFTLFNGRLFDGRTVRASYYDEQKFSSGNLKAAIA